MTKRMLVLLLGMAALCGLFLFPAAHPVSAGPLPQSDDPVERGRYLTTIAGCRDCHSPINEDGIPISSQYFAGGRPFDLGPPGVTLSPNLTSDEETGLGAWTDEEIKTALTTGVSPSGYKAIPIMPYPAYSTMAEEDLDAIVAFLRTIEPIENAVPREVLIPADQLPPVEYTGPATAPDPSDTAARGPYLVNSVMACSDCHTPLKEDGTPNFDIFLAGGQPYEGPWGIVYGANITPHDETGIGTWTEEEIENIFRTGIRPDGRVIVLTPWVEYLALTDPDLDAIVSYLQNGIQPVENEVPEPALNEGFLIYVDQPEEEEPQQTGGVNPVWLIGGGITAALLIAGGVLLSRRGDQAGTSE